MQFDEAISVLRTAGFAVKRRGAEWHISAPLGSRGEYLQPEGAVLPEWVVISLAKAVQHRLTPEYKMREVARWN